MLEFLNPIKGFGVTFHEMFRKVETVEYPEVKKPTAPRFHGHHQLNRWPDGLEKCIGCELCAWACPADAIYVEGRDNTPEARFSPGERLSTNARSDPPMKDLISCRNFWLSVTSSSFFVRACITF